MPLEYPIIVGAGQLTNRSVDAQTAKEPLELMELASRRAEADAGGGALLAKVDSVQVVNVLAWPSADPPADLAARLNARPSETFYTTIGGNTPQSLVNDTAERIARGQVRLALPVGAIVLGVWYGIRWRGRWRAAALVPGGPAPRVDGGGGA